MYHGTLEIVLSGLTAELAQAVRSVESASPLSVAFADAPEGPLSRLAGQPSTAAAAREADASSDRKPSPALVIAAFADVDQARRQGLEALLGSDAGTPSADAAVAGDDAAAPDAGAIAPFLSTPDVIAVCPPDQAPAFMAAFPALADVWSADASPDEAAWRFSRWLSECERRARSHETAQFLETTINSIPCLVWYKTADGIHEKVNDSFCATVGKPKDDVQGKGHAYIWDVEADDPACIASEAQVMSTEQTCVSEEIVQSGQDTRLLTTYKSPLYNLDGSVMGTVGVAIDITQERAFERDLLQKNQTLESIFTAMDCGVLTHTVDGSRVIGVNQAALDILGYRSEEDMVARGFDMLADSVVEEDRAMLRRKIAELQNPGDSVSFEYTVLHEDGQELHVLGSAKLIERDGERYVQRFLLDYSDQKHEEERRASQQQSFIRALSENYLVVSSFDLDTGQGKLLRITDDADDELRRIFEMDLSFSELMEAYISRRVYPEDRDRLRQLFEPAALCETLVEHERMNVNFRSMVDGVLGYRRLTLVQAGSWDNGPNGNAAPDPHVHDERFFVMGLRDVDRETLAEMQQKEILEEALQRANRANEAKSAFLSNMSHDIRTPMNAILGFTTLAGNHMDDTERVKEYLEKISTSSAHLLSLINDILDMSRIESGKVVLEERPHDLSRIVDDLGGIVHAQVQERSLRFDVDLLGLEHPQVMCDELKVKQVLLNVLGNAIKFTPEGGQVALKVVEGPFDAGSFGSDGDPADDDGEHVVLDDIQSRRSFAISIADTGIGMDPKFVEHIFDPFERERTSTLSGTQGTGLGMSIAKRLMDMMGGTISVESEKGKGSVFTMVFPFRIREEANAGAQVGQASGAGAIGALESMPEQLRGMRILLVDDNDLNREIAATILEDVGFQVDHAVNGQQAVDVLSGSHPGFYQLVLMDIQMPILNGYEAAQAIRALSDERPDLGQIPILAVTADAFEEDRKRALACGMDGHLAKPIEVDALLDALKDILSEER